MLAASICLFLMFMGLIPGVQTQYFEHLANAARIANFRNTFSDIHSYLEDLREIAPAHLLKSAGQIEDFGFQQLIANRQLELELTTPAPSVVCSRQIGELLVALSQRKKWALQMLDAAGKPGSGLLMLLVSFYGSYDECLKVRAKVYNGPENTTKPVDHFKGRYCRVMIPLQQPPGNSSGPQPPAPVMGPSITYGVCLPDSCNEQDVLILFHALLDAFNISSRFRFFSAACQEENLELDTKATAVLVVVCFFVLLMVMGTVYDIVFIQWSNRTKPLSGFEALKSEEPSDINAALNIKIRANEHTPLLESGNDKSHSGSHHKPAICGRVLLAFSVYSNGCKILNTNQPPGSLTAIHGIRFISMTWIILGHDFVFGISVLENFASYFPDVLKRFTFQAINSGPVAVDTFFTLSGLLVAYLSLKELNKKGGRINWLMFYFHRFWRLTPPYMLVLMVYAPLFPYLNNGPVWPQKGVEINKCEGSWWTNLLYINNFVKKEEMCMGWSWYLANDMQFYILSPLIFVPFFFSGIFGTISCLVFLLATMISAGVISRVNHLQTSISGGGAGGNPEIGNYFFDYYIVPYCRMGPYIIGMITGYLLNKTECKYKMSWIQNLLGWAVATASALAVVYGLYDVAQGHPITYDVAALYNAVHRTVWGMCVCWVIFACATGNGGYVNRLLSWHAIIPLSRLTYCTYLIHPIVMYFYFYSQKAPIYITDINIVCIFLGHLVASYAIAFIVSLAFEAPMMGLERVFLKREKQS